MSTTVRHEGAGAGYLPPLAEVARNFCHGEALVYNVRRDMQRDGNVEPGRSCLHFAEPSANGGQRAGMRRQTGPSSGRGERGTAE